MTLGVWGLIVGIALVLCLLHDHRPRGGGW